MLPEETRRKISESMKRHHAERRRKRMENWGSADQAEADRKLYFTVVDEYRRAGVDIPCSKDLA